MTKILSGIATCMGKALDYTATRKWCAKTLDYATKDPMKYATYMVIASIVSKDFINCYYYTTQSLNNKKIPEEKRKFVASLDLMNGIIMVFGQLLAGIGFEKVMNSKLFNKYIAQKLDEDVLKKHAKKLVEKAKNLTKPASLEDIQAELIKQYGSNSKKFKAMKGGFGLVITFFATTAFTKRVLAPLFSTPLAGWFSEKYMNKKPKNPKAIEDRTYYQWHNYQKKSDKPSFNKFN